MDRKPETRICLKCGIAKPIDDFETRRLRCRSCKRAGDNKNASSSYVVYLYGLHVVVKTRAKRRNQTMTLTRDDLVALWDAQNGRCALSGVVMTHHRDGTGKKEFNASLDRISNVGGYDRHNCQLVAYRVNILKNKLTEDNFYWWIKTIHDFSCD